MRLPNFLQVLGDWWICKGAHLARFEQAPGRLYLRCDICGLRTDGIDLPTQPRAIAPERRRNVLTFQKRVS